MYFSKVAVFISLAVSAFAAPTPAVQKRALSFRAYNDFQISDGVGGNALAEVNEAFPVDMTDPASVSEDDFNILVAARQTSENAEAEFNDAIDAAGGSSDGDALTVGKIKNKVLKLRTFEMVVQIQQAQGTAGSDADKQLEDIQAKLAQNVQTDEQNSGKTSQGVNFTGDVQP
ncbi:uncharacterized protein BCR38DRAFT_480125 [Pseudomassariella vexata]|uniref:Small secreted protein n=1 Tax=Pseudomassariella vexata TaxID=1141098 RepID=A0A1Y2EL84_9PEZI|nr:uncharacterized protein BCR38DRAFT_480125 [Pseudomassariella vexata]ORY71625.1 hypothetical protein BCR38DRAFT_480125 [Pseudomassariella vexata]